jgi:hypothetical protein
VVIGQAFGLLAFSDCLAQSDDRADVISATFSSIADMLQKNGVGLNRGAMAFDARVLRADRGPAPRGWPDSVVLTWVGDARSSSFSPREVRVVLAEANRAGAGQVRWRACGISPGQESCDPRRFSAVVAVSEPLICGDGAQVLASIRYWSTDTLHPSVWEASVIRLRRIDGKWVAGEWHNQGSN